MKTRERERETPRCERYANSSPLSVTRSQSSTTSKNGVVSSPSQYFVLGFKDRNLEAEYWNDVTLTSKYRILLGWFVSTLLFVVGKLGHKRLIVSPGGACSYWSPSESIGADLLLLTFALRTCSRTDDVYTYAWRHLQATRTKLHLDVRGHGNYLRDLCPLHTWLHRLRCSVQA